MMTTTTSSTSTLPLEWTRVKRRRRQGETTSAAVKSHPSNRDDCLEGDDCIDCLANLPSLDGNASFQRAASGQQTSTQRILKGTAYFCLPDPDCDWFQGYFFPENQAFAETSLDDERATKTIKNDLFDSPRTALLKDSNHYFGLLCIAQEMDDCLKCDAGGYRHLSMQLNEFSSLTRGSRNGTTKTTIPNVIWTGGDMMELRTTDHQATADATDDTDTIGALSSTKNAVTAVTTTTGTKALSNVPTVGQPIRPMVLMQSDTIWTGTAAASRVDRIFASLVGRLRQEQQDSHTANSMHDRDGDNRNNVHSVLDLMPQVAVVQGTMQLVLPMQSN